MHALVYAFILCRFESLDGPVFLLILQLLIDIDMQLIIDQQSTIKVLELHKYINNRIQIST